MGIDRTRPISIDVAIVSHLVARDKACPLVILALDDLRAADDEEDLLLAADRGNFALPTRHFSRLGASRIAHSGTGPMNDRAGDQIDRSKTSCDAPPDPTWVIFSERRCPPRQVWSAFEMKKTLKVGRWFESQKRLPPYTGRTLCGRTAHANSLVVIIGTVITRIPVVDVWREPIPVKKGRTPEWSGEKPVFLKKDRSGDKMMLVAAKDPGLFTAKVPSRKKPVLAAAELPSRKKPVLPAAKVRWETHVPAAPAIPALRNRIRRFHDCQRCHRSEKCDALQHAGLLYLSIPRHLTLQAHTRDRKDSIGGW
jgi:hypothetical protein